MRYYRTKDGKVIRESDIPDYWGGLVEVVGLDLDYKMSDNLEELCDYLCIKIDGDELVLINTKTLHSNDLLKKMMHSSSVEYIRLMNVIDKDFKCVAEMNKDGEWELLCDTSKQKTEEYSI